MGVARKGKMYWTSCLEGGEEISSLSLKSAGKLRDVTPDTFPGTEFLFTQIGNIIKPGSTIPGKTLMQGVQATLKLFRALWEQHFFVGHF